MNATKMLKDMSKFQAKHIITSVGAYDPITDTYTDGATIDTPFYTYQSRASNSDINSGVATSEDVVFLAGTDDLNVELNNGDIIEATSKRYAIKRISPVYGENGKIELYKLYCVVN